MKIADIEIIELQNIPVTPPLFQQPLRTALRLLKVKTYDGLVGLSQLDGFSALGHRGVHPAGSRAL